MAPLTWNEYYRLTVPEGNTDFSAMAAEIGRLGVASADTLKDGGSMLMNIESEEHKPSVCLLVPGRARSVKSIHSCFGFEGGAWGLHGNRASAALVEVPLNKMKEGIYLGKQEHPSLEAMSECTDPNSFKELKGTATDGGGDLRSNRNNQATMVPVAMYSKYLRDEEVKADVLAIRIMSEAKEKGEDLKQFEDLLTYLWCVASGLCQVMQLPIS
ncbi:MAG: hypothetical protein SGARI_006138 [Bacillariaceae sp.]